MNKNLLRSHVVRNGDSMERLAEGLGIQRSTLSAKMNEYRGAEFTQNEIRCIKERYQLTAEDVDEIFFDLSVS